MRRTFSRISQIAAHIVWVLILLNPLQKSFHINVVLPKHLEFINQLPDNFEWDQNSAKKHLKERLNYLREAAEVAEENRAVLIVS